MRRVGCDSNGKRKVPIREDVWQLSDFPESKRKNYIRSDLLKDEIRKKQMGREMVPDPESEG